MTLLLICLLAAHGGIRLDRLIEAELEALEPIRAAAPHGWIDHNLHLS
jgi:hypothetical protein